MPLTVNKFSSSFFGKLLVLLSIGLVSHYKIIYGIVLAILFIVISEIGYMESFGDIESFSANDKQNAGDKNKQNADNKKNAGNKNKQNAGDKQNADNKKKQNAGDKNKQNADKKTNKKNGKESMDNQVQASKTAFIKDHCGAKRVNFDLETIQQDYTGLMFSDGVCDPCDPACKFSIDNTSDSLYTYDENVNPVDKRQ
jgi:hypothetical protein